jgi:hypothetical protein
MTVLRFPLPASSAGFDFAAMDVGCLGKSVFPSKFQAQRALDRQRHKAVFAGRGAVKAYRCQTCGRWHLGSSQL